MESKNEVHWYKNPLKKNYMITTAIFAFILWSIVVYFRIKPQRITSIIFFSFLYILTIFIIYIIIDNSKYFPQKYGFSNESLFFKYKREIKSYPWKSISNIGIYKIGIDKKLHISINGKTELISFLTKKHRDRIIDYYQKIKQ